MCQRLANFISQRRKGSPSSPRKNLRDSTTQVRVGSLHTFEYYDPVNGVSLGGRSRIITLELSKLNDVVEKSTEEMNTQEKWAVYFECLTDTAKRSKINEIMEQEEGIAMAGEVLMTISRDEVERAMLMSEEKYQLDRQSDLAWERKQGEIKGFEKGEKKGEEKGRKYVLDLFKQGLSLEEVKLHLEQAASNK